MLAPVENSDEAASSSKHAVASATRFVSLKIPYEWEQLSKLWNLQSKRQAQRRAELRPFMIEIAHNSEHLHQWDALIELWYSFDKQKEQNRTDVRSVLIEIARNFEHLRQWGAVNLLWDSQTAQNRAEIRSVVTTIAQDPQDARQVSAIVHLRDSDNPADRALSLALQRQYFPKQSEQEQVTFSMTASPQSRSPLPIATPQADGP